VSFAAIIPAAGQGKRLGSRVPKQYLKVLGVPLLVRTLRALLSAYPFKEVVVVVDLAQHQNARALVRRYRIPRTRVVTGQATRAGSVLNGLKALTTSARFVVVHDAARPLVSKEVVRRTLAAAKTGGAALCGIPVSSTVKNISSDGNHVLGTADRRQLYLAQTPQAFRKDLLLGRYKALGKKATLATDEAALFDGTSTRVRMVEGHARNIKVTTKEDLEMVKVYLRGF